MVTADTAGAVAQWIFKGGDVADGEVAAVTRLLRTLDANTVIDEVDVRVIRDLLDSYRESRRPATAEDYVQP